MATYTAPTTRTTGALISASIWNTDIVENLKYLKDAPTFDGAVKVTGALTPNTNDGSALGSATVSWADLFLASGGVINFANGDVTITHSSNTLAFAGGTNYTFDAGGTFGPVQIKQVSAFLSNSPDALLGWAVGFSGYTDGTLILQPRSSGGTPIVFATGSTTASERVRITSGGDLLVGTTGVVGSAVAGRTHIVTGSGAQLVLRHSAASAGKFWQIGPDDSSNNLIIYNQALQGVYIPDGGTSWTSSSDERIKDIIEPISNAAQKVSSLRAVIGKYKTDDATTRRSFLIAQDVQAVLPEAVSVKDDAIGTLGLSYTDVIPLLVAAVQEQQQKIDALEARIH